jgi:hypothetical protein
MKMCTSVIVRKSLTNLFEHFRFILFPFALILLLNNAYPQDQNIPQSKFSLEIGSTFNADFFYLGSDISFLILAKQDVSIVLSGYFNPTARKVLHQESSDVYLLLSEYRIWTGLGLQKNQKLNRTISLFARAQIGWGWINYAGSNADFNDPVAPVLTGGLQFSFPIGNDYGSSSLILIKTGYQYLRFGSDDSHLAFVTLGINF